MASFTVRSRLKGPIVSAAYTATTAEQAIYHVVATGASAGYEIEVLSATL